ncbi:MAG: iron ABC transporter permease [Phycisphaerales bacterium]|mgnify:FL=1|jgi:iron(III) transport system permease protein|nr:iron ABC transporter permease [Phycisphaerales bacterium]MDP6311503.1 iron ABC transporter permease [Phycisphaerales bacterium]MDP7087709.1 iron ABC transporter permease [Phycisphaerales bacterium]MDP7189834.1 iron ABC transporter permease [Phycisphaerales bacterium]MDP7519037.1 iron ABC transporter permease [Phycisphaerales bacterium]|tara:strand:+ start:3549 stop:5276 length:1728 start_codon:yes stop_codon:yes gene_type:complete
MRRARFGSYLLLALVLLGFALFLIYPIWLTVAVGFEGKDGGFTLHHVLTVLKDPSTRIGLINALGIAVFTTTAALLISIPLALVSVKCDFPGKAAFNAVILVPLILPPFVGAIGLHHLLGRHGAISEFLIWLGLTDRGVDFVGHGGFWAIVLIEALHLYPIIYLNAAAALANLDPALEEAASGLGASAWRRLRQIVMPLIRPGLFAGGTIVFIWSFTELGTPLMFDYQQVTPVQIFNGIKEMEGSTQPYALTAVLLIVAAGIYLIGKVFLGGRASTMYAKASIRSVPRKLGKGGSIAAIALFSGVTFAAMLPHISVVLASLSVEGAWYDSIVPTQWTGHNYETALSHPLASGSIRNSLAYSSIAIGIDLIAGLAIGYLIVRVKVRGRGLVDALAMLPLAVPGLVMAFGYVAMTLRWPFGKDDPLEGFISVVGANPNPMLLLVIAYAVRRLPYIVRSTVAGLEQTSGELEEAALNLGASRTRAIRTVVIPLITANLIAGGLLAFSFAMLEVSDSLILAQRESDYPITKAIYVLFERLGDGPGIASAMGVWAMALLAVTLVGASALMGRKMGAIFRV